MKVDSVLVAVILEILWKYKYKYIWFVSLLCCHWNTVYLNNLSTSPKSLLGAHPTFYQPAAPYMNYTASTYKTAQVRPWTYISETTGWIYTIQSAMELSRPVVVQQHRQFTLTLDFQGQILKMLYLRNGRTDQHRTKGIWVDRVLCLLCDLQLWPWPWIFKVKFWNWCI